MFENDYLFTSSLFLAGGALTEWYLLVFFFVVTIVFAVLKIGYFWAGLFLTTVAIIFGKRPSTVERVDAERVSVELHGERKDYYGFGLGLKGPLAAFFALLGGVVMIVAMCTVVPDSLTYANDRAESFRENGFFGVFNETQVHKARREFTEKYFKPVPQDTLPPTGSFTPLTAEEVRKLVQGVPDTIPQVQSRGPLSTPSETPGSGGD